MVIALLTLPAAVAGHFSRQLWQMMILAVLVCMPDYRRAGRELPLRLPTGPVIIVLAAAAYLAVILGSRLPLRRERG